MSYIFFKPEHVVRTVVGFPRSSTRISSISIFFALLEVPSHIKISVSGSKHSAGHKKPQDVLCNLRGGTNLPLLSVGVDILRK